MGCSSCSSKDGSVPNGCGNNGLCSSGGCNKLNTYDWLSKMDLNDPLQFDVVEVSFKNGSRKDFYRLKENHNNVTGDLVVVDTGTGYDVGKISLSGELVKLQLRKKKVPKDRVFNHVIRKANERDVVKLSEARAMEIQTMIRARVIARTLGLDMKIGDVEYQGDKRKATFYYTADGRVDFRELIRQYAKEFKVKIEMRQIGSRQESGKIGGIGSCGRELCCSTWLTDFKSVNTNAARYQNIAINQTKLSGQCGRLKCCLNFELDSYMDALEDFPKKMEKIRTQSGVAELVKTDIFKGLMFYAYEKERGRRIIVTLTKERVKELQAMIKKGEKIFELASSNLGIPSAEPEMDFEDVTGQIELPAEKRKSKRRNNRNRKPKKPNKNSNNKNQQNKSNSAQPKDKPKNQQRTNKSRKPNKGNNNDKQNNK